MGNTEIFARCIYCFAPKEESGPCPVCGYDNGLCCPPAWWLMPGTLLKGRYVVGRHLRSDLTELTYLGWDLQEEQMMEITEFYPEGCVTRDITHCETVSCIPGRRSILEQRQANFVDKAKRIYRSAGQAERWHMDLFARNETCYYVRRKTAG